MLPRDEAYLLFSSTIFLVTTFETDRLGSIYLGILDENRKVRRAREIEICQEGDWIGQVGR